MIVKNWSSVLVIALVATALSLPRFAGATVTIRGQVKYWDQIRGAYFPAKNVFLEIEGDWAGIDPERQTDSGGRYSVTIRDPYWGDFNGVDIEAYASTPGQIQVFASEFSLFTYNATSRERDGVSSGSAEVIDLRIGGPDNNVGDVYNRTAAETANAFLVHQTIYDMRSTMRSKGFPNAAFDEVEVIVPAASPTGVSYTNPITGFINLALDSAGVLGLDTWAELPTAKSGYQDMNRFVQMVMHEYTHSFHEAMTGATLPSGLISPSFHGFDKETDIWIAFTEGFAEFMPAAIANAARTKLEWSRTRDGATSYDKAFRLPERGYHAAMEGEVAGLFWDLFDGTGEEPVRSPATQSHDGRFAVPQAIVDGQMFRDRLSDANLTRIIRVMRTYTFGVGSGDRHPVETIHEFLDEYKRLYPADTRALKVIAYNRGILFYESETDNHAPIVKRDIRASRAGSVLTLAFTVEEKDADDRANVTAAVWLDKGGGGVDVRKLLNVSLSNGWNGATLAISRGIALPAGTTTADKIWVVLSDEMLPTAYRLSVPRTPKKNLVVQLGPHARRAKLDVKKLRIQKDTYALSRGEGASPVVIAQNMKAFHDNAVAFRSALTDARRELRDAATRESVALKHERRLFSYAVRAGEIASRVKPSTVFPRERTAQVRSRAVSADADAAKRAFDAWLLRGPSARAFQGKFDAAQKRWLAGEAATATRNATAQSTIDARMTAIRNRLRAATVLLKANPQLSAHATAAENVISKMDRMLDAVKAAPSLERRLNRVGAALRVLGRD